MKPGFYISMGIAIGALVVGFVLLYDIQQERDEKFLWIQKIPIQCNDVWAQEYDEFYKINPELIETNNEESKNTTQTIIQAHYEKLGITILEVNLEIGVFDGVRCEACSCLGWDRLSIKIPVEDIELIPDDENWEPIG